MNRPVDLGQQLSFRFQASVDVPELGQKHQTAESLDAARVNSQRVGLRGARLVVWDDHAAVVLVALAGIQLRGSTGCCESRRCDSGYLHIDMYEEQKMTT